MKGKDVPLMQLKHKWYDRDRRFEQLDEYVNTEHRTRFGFENLSEAEKAERVRRHFDSVAYRYDVMNTLLSLGIHYLWKRKAVHLLDLDAGSRVLDVCGGTGDLSILADRSIGHSGQVVLCDINWDMMAAGRSKRTNAAARRRIRYVQGDAEQIPFPDDTFDAVMVGFAVRNITHMKQAFKEMVRVLRPAGKFLCLEFSRPVWGWFRWLYDFYSFNVMPALGKAIAGDKKAYTCLPETIRQFLLPHELSEIFEEAGLSRIRYRLLTNGIAVAHIGFKPVEPSSSRENTIARER